MRRAIEVLLLAICLTGCVAAINERAQNRWMGDELICGIDSSVVDETEKLLPNGWITKPYSPVYWQQYWNNRVFYLAKYDFQREQAKGYTGPSGKTLVLYALRQRQEAHLPNVVSDERNNSTLVELYSELGSSTKSSCAILGRPSPVCSLPHRGQPAYQRQCSG